MRKIGKTEAAIAERFFWVIEELGRRRVIRGLQTFTKLHGLNYGNMNTLKNHQDRCGVKTEYLAFIAKDYGVSCQWLLLGEGEVFLEGSPALQG